MQFFWNSLFLIGYLLAFGPPRAISLLEHEKATDGELKNAPPVLLVLIELGVRLTVLMVIALTLQNLMTNQLYEIYRLDMGFFIVGAVAIVHTGSYFLFLVLLRDMMGSFADRIYRLLRNLSYSFLPGLGAVFVVLVWEWQQKMEPFSSGYIETVYQMTTLVMLVASVVEAAFVKRTPQGLDKLYKA